MDLFPIVLTENIQSQHSSFEIIISKMNTVFPQLERMEYT